MENEQNEIFELEFPHNVRHRPGMYLPNITHMPSEIIDNSLDEYLNGYCDKISIFIIDDKIYVGDNGRGIPVKPSKKNPKVSQLELAASTLHAGGKFNLIEDEKGNFKSVQGGVKTSGLHGVGLSVVNALSEIMEIIVKTNGKEYLIGYEKGKKVIDLHVVKDIDINETGTEVCFTPDKTIWNQEDDIIDFKALKNRVKTIAYLNPGLTMELFVQMGDAEPLIDEVFCFADGMKEFISSKTKGLTKITEPIIISGTHNGIEVDLAIAYTDSYDEGKIYSFVNNSSTKDGGDHVNGLRAAFNGGIYNFLTNAFGELKIGRETVKMDIDDFLEGVVSIISVKVENPYFEGQGKAKIKMNTVRQAVKKIVEDYMFDYLDHNPKISDIIWKKAASATKGRVAAVKARELSRTKKELNSKYSFGDTAGKLAGCTSKDPELCEIYIVEGDSAGGSAKQGRNRKYQAVIPIFGKVINAIKKRKHEVMMNDKLGLFLTAIGANIEELDIEKIKYHKIIIMSDADVDGSHIKTLWIAFIYKYLRPIIEHGYLYLSCPPLYKIEVGKNSKEVYYAINEEEKDAIVSKLGNKTHKVQRFKGLGEMNPSQLWDTTMNPETRILEQVTIDDAEEAEYMLSLCMGEEVAPRRELITENSKSANLDY